MPTLSLCPLERARERTRSKERRVVIVQAEGHTTHKLERDSVTVRIQVTAVTRRVSYLLLCHCCNRPVKTPIKVMIFSEAGVLAEVVACGSVFGRVVPG